jgi:glycosyltransferase involved in cell wall biosynthesis
MASGLPVVASDVGGIGEALAAPAAGLLAPAGDVPALSAAVVQVLSDRELQCRLGEQGRIRSRSFSWTVNAQKTLALYSDIALNREPEPHDLLKSTGVA